MFQGYSQVWGTQQPSADVPDHGLPGPYSPVFTAEEAAQAGPGEPGGHHGHHQGRQPSHTRVPIPVQEPKVELLHQELPQGEEPLRQDR